MISIVFIPTEPGLVRSGVSLFTFTSNKTLPSPIMLGVTVNTRAASLKVSCPSPPETGIWSPCFIWAVWLSKENNFGLEIVLLNPSASRASNWSFSTAEPVFLSIPIPLVAPIALKL